MTTQKMKPTMASRKASRARSGRFFGGGLCALVAFTALGAVAGAASPMSPSTLLGTPSPDGPGGRRLAKLLIDARGEEYAAEKIRDGAVSFGSASIPAILDVLEAGTFHEKRTSGGVVVHALNDSARLGLASALGSFQWESVRRRIEQRLEGEPTLQTRSTVLFVMGAAVPADSLMDLLVPLIGVPRAQERGLRQPLQRALVAALARDSRLHGELKPFFKGTPPTFLRTVVAAIKAGGDQAALDGLASLLGAVPDADPLLMIELADLAKTVVRPVPSRTLDRVRRAIASSNESVQVEAAKSLGRLDDVAAVPMLIEALASGSGPLRTEAKVALDRLSAERYGSDAAAWRQWYSDSQRWLQGEAPRWRADLRSADQSRVSRALLQIARYRIYRYEFVEDVAAALASGNENTCIVACAVLGHFATSGSIEPLLKALNHPLIPVRKAALEALERATGANHGEHASEWRAAGWPRS